MMSGRESSIPRGNTEQARLLFQAVEHRNREQVMAIYAENIVINEAPSLPYGGEYRGLEGGLRHGMGFRAAWDAFQGGKMRGLEPRFIAQDDHVVVVWHHKAENSQTGQRINLPAVSVYRFVDGKIVESRMFHFDTAALLRFLGSPAASAG